MILFRKYYKLLNDDIKPNRELIEEILKKAEAKNPAPFKSYRNLRWIATPLAAVFVVVIFAASGIGKQASLSERTSSDLVAPLTESKIEAKETENIKKAEAPLMIKDAENAPQIEALEDLNTPINSRTMDAPSFSAKLSEVQATEEEDAQKMSTLLGEKLNDFNKENSFKIKGKFNFQGNTFYLGEWENGESFVVDKDLNFMHKATFDENNIYWNAEENFLE